MAGYVERSMTMLPAVPCGGRTSDTKARDGGVHVVVQKRPRQPSAPAVYSTVSGTRFPRERSQHSGLRWREVKSTGFL